MTQVTLKLEQTRVDKVAVSDTEVIVPVDISASLVVVGGGIVVTIGGASVTAIAGDDVTITGSVDGVNFFAVGASGAALVQELDASVQSVVVGKVTHLKFTPAQILSTETATLNIVSTIG